MSLSRERHGFKDNVIEMSRTSCLRSVALPDDHRVAAPPPILILLLNSVLSTIVNVATKPKRRAKNQSCAILLLTASKDGVIIRVCC